MTDVADAVEETVEALERIPTAHLNGTTKPQQIIILATVAVGGAMIGATISHIWTKKVLTTKFDQLLTREIEAAKYTFSRMNKVDEEGNALTPQQIAEEQLSPEALQAARSYSGGTSFPVEAPAKTEEELVVTDDGESNKPANEAEVSNIFDGRELFEDEWDPTLEEASRTPDKPYIITHGEYYNNEPDFEQDELTWFEGDGVLADNQDIPIPDVESAVGEAHLMMFGHGSHDRNVVYIRNEKMSIDYEVTRSNGEYTKQVLGLGNDADEPEIRHSWQPNRNRKFRSSDE